MTRALALLLLLAVSTVAADEQSALQRCASIQSDSRRLSCFDELAGRGNSTDTAIWREDRSRGIALVQDADRAFESAGQKLRPQLVLRCLDRKLTTEVFIGTQLREEHGGDDRTVILRFGHEAPFSERLKTSPDGISLLFDSPTMAASQLLLHDSLAFQFMPVGGRQASVTFDTRGLEQAIPPLLEACKLRTADDGILEPAD